MLRGRLYKQEVAIKREQRKQNSIYRGAAHPGGRVYSCLALRIQYTGFILNRENLENLENRPFLQKVRENLE